MDCLFIQQQHDGLSRTIGSQSIRLELSPEEAAVPRGTGAYRQIEVAISRTSWNIEQDVRLKNEATSKMPNGDR